MLTPIEKILFLLLLLTSISLSYKSFKRMFRIISKGTDPIDWKKTLMNIPQGIIILIGQRTLFNSRSLVGFIHAIVAWGFTLYLMVNIVDALEGIISNFRLFGDNFVGLTYNFFVDIFSALVLLGVLYFIIRRFIFDDKKLEISDSVYLSSEAKIGIKRDSLIVGLFIIIHVSARFIGESFKIVLEPHYFQPFASSLSILWSDLDPTQLSLGLHISWWIALGSILAFMPYFPYSKHAHLFMGPLNYMVPNSQRVKGLPNPINFEDESIEQFGVGDFRHLSQKSLLDSYACIMCNRCQDNCPAYNTSKELSPSAIEINKRYFFNQNGNNIIDGTETPIKSELLTDNALWACTSCNYCVYACPVGNEPLKDILMIRQDKVMMESKFPEELVITFKNLETNFNPWSFSSQDREVWAEGLDIKTLAKDQNCDILYWVGCAGSFDKRYQNVSRSFAEIMKKAEINFRILGNEEKCTGDTARRLGNEYLAQNLMMENIETLNNYSVKEIVTTCPHCYNSLKNEYPQFGGEYKVLHHSEFIDKLREENKITLKNNKNSKKMTYHDSCYLGRYNSVFDQPRRSLKSLDSIELVEMKRSYNNGFCCGAGGGRMFLEETEGTKINVNRTEEAMMTGAETIASGCPFCMTMLTDGVKSLENEEKVQVKDIAEVILENIQ